MNKPPAGVRCLVVGVALVPLLWPAILYAQSATEQVLRACRAETATRLKISDKEVIAQPSEMAEQREGGLLVKWFTPSGAQGECRYENDRLASWMVTRKGRPFNAEAACAAAVAKQQRVRPGDVEIVDTETRGQTSTTVFWTTYQGETGKCLTSQNRIISVERD